MHVEKTLCFLLSLLLILGLAACSGPRPSSGAPVSQMESSGVDSADSTASSLSESMAEESSASEKTPANTEPSGEGSTVYFTDDISPEGMLEIYNALQWSPTGKVAVKLSTGEPPASNYLRPELIADVVKEVDGTIVECNTAYGGSRSETDMHYQVAEDHALLPLPISKSSTRTPP